MCFQREEDLARAPTEHLSNLRHSCMHYPALEKGFHYLISNELINRREELRIGEYAFIKPEIEFEVSKLHIFLNQQFFIEEQVIFVSFGYLQVMHFIEEQVIFVSFGYLQVMHG
ncbi:hypothetical protein LXL04_004187 [Taraxacum kok-saghyz]